MKHLGTILVAGMAAIVIALIVSVTTRTPDSKVLATKPNQMKLVLANTPESWKKGLSGHPQPDDEHGMLFDFGKLGKRCMWNKGIPYAVDVGFYDERWKLLGGATMEANSEKAVCSVSPARYAVELRGGWFRDHSKKGK